MSRAPRLAPAPAPTFVAIVGAIALVWIIGPVLALGIRVPWASLGEILRSPDTLELLRITLSAAVLSTLVTLALGLPLAMWVQHLRRGARVVRLLILLPLAMPPVVAGLGLTALIGRRGLLSPLLDALNLQFAFAFPGVVAAHVFIALPFVVVTLDSALRQIDREIPASAAGIGLTPNQIAWRITLPAIAPSIATAAGLAFARSLGEFGTTLTFAGSMPGVTRTMSLGIYLERETDQAAAYALSAILIVLAVLSLIIASLPPLFRKQHSPEAREIGEIDTAKLRELTRPATTGVGVTINGTDIPADRITAIIGPNGSGKTTLVGQIAGRLTGAEVTIGGRVVDKHDQRPLPAHKRGVVLLTQRPGLPRTTTVVGAIAMVTQNENEARALLGAAGLAELADTPVAALSGGQAAQVALVRALSARPAVLILDEPLAAVDVASARAWRHVLRAIAPDRTTILITHNPLDIAGLSEHLIVMERGQVVSAGDTKRQLEVPATSFVAGISGLNRLMGIIVSVNDGIVSFNASGISMRGKLIDRSVSPDALGQGKPIVATFPPSATTLRLPSELASGTRAPQESARNVWRGVIESMDTTPAQPAVTVFVSIGDSDGRDPQKISVPVTRESALELGLEAGVTVECVTKALNISVHPQRLHTGVEVNQSTS
ncbi:ATP-binding cassette domain-containing protein [Corynebacterium lubricantis]|uniref:ATP-binding cassette domain-containing protein n=1 Tax=Corynebacterium lubricantis TaxID=541095 RepID=UPI0003652EEF|nr:ATP-binding cassette domain-containing protein [Corynebacterium lubricantis]